MGLLVFQRIAPFTLVVEAPVYTKHLDWIP
jgi:hypothetical protein